MLNQVEISTRRNIKRFASLLTNALSGDLANKPPEEGSVQAAKQSKRTP